MAKKQKAAAAQSEPVTAPAAVTRYTDGDPAGKTALIRVWSEGDVYADYYHETAKEREVYIGGAPYDHANTDADGVWIYRQDRKN